MILAESKTKIITSPSITIEAIQFKFLINVLLRIDENKLLRKYFAEKAILDNLRVRRPKA